MTRRNTFIILFTLIAVGALLYNLLGGNEDEEKVFSVAVVSPSTHPSIKTIEEGLKDSLIASPQPFAFRFYRVGNGTRGMKAKVENMSQKNFDLVVTIGAEATERTIECFKEKNIKTPIVFTGISLSLKQKLIPRRDNRQLTGVIEVKDFASQLRVIRKLKEDVSNITILYDETSPCIAEDVDEIRAHLQNSSITLTAVGVSEGSQIEPKLSQVENLDTILVLKDNLIVDNLDQLVLICNRKKVPLFTTELDSIGRGAAVGYGVIERSFGDEAAKRVYQILVDKKKPSEVSVGPVDQFYVLVNDSASMMQGLTVQPEVLDALRKEGF